MDKEKTPPLLYRCSCGNILRLGDIAKGVCVGHKVSFLGEGTFLEWLKVMYWQLTGRLDG